MSLLRAVARITKRANDVVLFRRRLKHNFASGRLSIAPTAALSIYIRCYALYLPSGAAPWRNCSCQRTRSPSRDPFRPLQAQYHACRRVEGTERFLHSVASLSTIARRLEGRHQHAQKADVRRSSSSSIFPICESPVSTRRILGVL